MSANRLLNETASTDRVLWGFHGVVWPREKECPGSSRGRESINECGQCAYVMNRHPPTSMNRRYVHTPALRGEDPLSTRNISPVQFHHHAASHARAGDARAWLHGKRAVASGSIICLRMSGLPHCGQAIMSMPVCSRNRSAHVCVARVAD